MFLVDFICTNLPLKKDEKIELLRIDSLRERTYRLPETPYHLLKGFLLQ